jgi:hypothetical protein
MKPVPLYCSNGEVGAFLAYPQIYDPTGEWIGFVTAGREVYSILGYYVGNLSEDRRILRPRTLTSPAPRLEPPTRPPKLRPPSNTPLAPLMRELTHSTVDVLLEEPERLHTQDMGELRPDLE